MIDFGFGKDTLVSKKNFCKMEAIGEVEDLFDDSEIRANPRAWNILIKGAGTADANGLWIPGQGHRDRPYWVKQKGGSYGINYGSRWFISSDDGASWYKDGGQHQTTDLPIPPQAGWITNKKGRHPAPTLEYVRIPADQLQHQRSKPGVNRQLSAESQKKWKVWDTNYDGHGLKRFKRKDTGEFWTQQYIGQPPPKLTHRSKDETPVDWATPSVDTPPLDVSDGEASLESGSDEPKQTDLPATPAVGGPTTRVRSASGPTTTTATTTLPRSANTPARTLSGGKTGRLWEARGKLSRNLSGASLSSLVQPDQLLATRNKSETTRKSGKKGERWQRARTENRKWRQLSGEEVTSDELVD